MYSCLLEGLFDKKAYEKDKKEKRKKEIKDRRKKDKGEKTPHPNQTKKQTKIAISVACILMRCKPLPNNISTENGKNDVLQSQCQC